MKRISFLLLISALLFLCFKDNSYSINGAWNSIYPYDGGMLIDMSCADTNHCIFSILNDDINSLMLTTDGGSSWKAIWESQHGYNDIGRSIMTYCIDYKNKSFCLVGCDSGYVLRTIDAGLSWDTIKVEGTKKIEKILMADERSGYLIAKNMNKKRTLFITEDSGWNWNEVVKPQEFKFHLLNDFSVVDTNTVLLLTQDEDSIYVLSSFDKGKNWKKNYAPTGTEKLQFLSKSLGWLSGSLYTGVSMEAKQVIYKTTDSGSTWIKQRDTLKQGVAFWGINILDSLHGIVTSYLSNIYRTTDGGNNWIEETIGEPEPYKTISKVQYVSNSRVFAIKNLTGIYRWDVTTAIENELPISSFPIKAYPNPISRNGILNVEFDRINSGNVQIELRDLEGRKIWKSPDEMTDQNHWIYNINLDGSLSSSCYWLIINSSNQTKAIPIIVTE